MLCNITFVDNDRGQTLPVGLHQVCTHLSCYFSPFFHTDLLQSSDVSMGNMSFQLPPQIFYWVEIWTLARPPQDLKCSSRSHSFVARAMCLGSLLCWKTQPRLIFNVLAERRFLLKISQYIYPFILSLTRISRFVPFAEKQP